MRIKRMAYLIGGFLCLGLGTVGVLLPILPTVPFFLLTVCCFAKSSQKLHDWFVGTTLYKSNVEPFLEKKGMTWKAKISVMMFMTVLMVFGFFMMKNAVIGRILLATVWVGHMIYFSVVVKTMDRKDVEIKVHRRVLEHEEV